MSLTLIPQNSEQNNIILPQTSETIDQPSSVQPKYQINVISSENVDSPKNQKKKEEYTINNNENNYNDYNLKSTADSIQKETINIINNAPQEQEQEERVKRENFRRATKKQTSKFLSQSFIKNQDEENSSEEEDIVAQPLLPQQPNQRPCLKARGKFRKQTTKKLSKSFVKKTQKEIDKEVTNNLMVDGVNTTFEELKAVNFNQKVRVERVISYKAYNVLEDELKQKILRNSRSVKEEAQQQEQRSRQPSIAAALGGANDNKICCLIF